MDQHERRQSRHLRSESNAPPWPGSPPLAPTALRSVFDYHDQVVACCRAAGFAPDARHTAHSITSQLAMVACGLGVALVPRSAINHDSQHRDGIHALQLEDSSTIDLAAVSHRTTNTLVQGLIDSAQAAISTSNP